MLWMNEIAVATSVAGAFMILSAFCLAKICDGAILDDYLVQIVVFSVHGCIAFFGFLFGRKLDVDVAHHVLSDVIGNDEVEDFSKLAELLKYLLEKVFEMCGCF